MSIKIVNASQLDANLTSVADAIRTKGSTSATLSFPDGFVSAISAISGAPSVDIQPLNVTENGTYSAPVGVAYTPINVSVPQPSGTLNVTSNNIYDIYSYVSLSVSVPTGVFPTGTVTISSNGTYDVNAYESASVEVLRKDTGLIERTIGGLYDNSEVSYLGERAFAMCSMLESVYLPNCSTISTWAFYLCSSLTGVDFSLCSIIGSSAFYSCSRLTNINFPSCTSIDQSGFANCNNLLSASFPVCTTIGYAAFYSCLKLNSISFPVCISIGPNAFYSCRSIAGMSFPVCNSIGSSAFMKCSALKSIYISASSVCTLGANAFSGTPIVRSQLIGYFGSIYVPASLVDSYKAATNWTAVSSRITSYV